MLKFFFINILLLLLVAAGGSYWVYDNRLTHALPIEKELHYIIKPNSSIKQVAQHLYDKKLVDYPTMWGWLAWSRWQKQAHLIKAGEYAIPVGTTPIDLLRIFVAGKSIQHRLTLLEGWNFKQMMDAINNNPHLEHRLKGMEPNAIMRELTGKAQKPEGYFYPDTYHFPLGMTDIAFLKRAHKKLLTELESAWAQRTDNTPVETKYEALILASLVEKETAKKEERTQIAGVFAQRLAKGMRLQTDPTVIYALGENYDGDIRKKDLMIDNPYNTYRYAGLPPTPIALVSRAALDAAIQPNREEHLFFVAKGQEGAHYFSASLAEHQCAVAHYQLKKGAPRKYRNFCNRNPQCFSCQAS